MTPTVTASSTFITAAPFKIHVLSETGKKLIYTIIQTNANSISNDGISPICMPVAKDIISGNNTASDAIHNGKLIQ